MNEAEERTSEPALNLKQAAAQLGVHYMTAYRYVRQGRLHAERVGTQWRVHPESVAAFLADGEADDHGNAGPRVGGAAGGVTKSRSGVDWPERLATALLAGDEPAAWSTVQRALAAGHDPVYCYLDMIAAAVARIDQQRDAGELNAAHQPLATAVAYRVTARLGASFRRPGRSRGSVVFGSPVGERHHLPIAIVADLIRLRGFDVLELGADTEPDAFAAAATHARRLVAVALSITRVEHLDAARDAVVAIRAAVPDAPIVVGGQAVLNPTVADLLDADAWAPDGRQALPVIDELATQTLKNRNRSRS